MAQLTPVLVVFLTVQLLTSEVVSITFTIVNKCEYTVWPGILSNAGVSPISSTGFALHKDESKTISAPSSWGGRFWGRTLCTEDSTGKFSCVTGDCGSGKVECAGNGATPPATLAEITHDGAGGLDFYDVSLVGGYNIPMLFVPVGGNRQKPQNCVATGCVVNLNVACPSELKVMGVGGSEGVACKSACEAFQQPQYCCSGAYDSPDTCKPSSYSTIFKSACPRAYSYAYDNKSSTFACASAGGYEVTFCPSPNTSDGDDADDDADDDNDDHDNDSNNNDDDRGNNFLFARTNITDFGLPLNLFISETDVTHYTQDEDYGCRGACPSIWTIRKDFTRRNRLA